MTSWLRVPTGYLPDVIKDAQEVLQLIAPKIFKSILTTRVGNNVHIAARSDLTRRQRELKSTIELFG